MKGAENVKKEREFYCVGVSVAIDQADWEEAEVQA